MSKLHSSVETKGEYADKHERHIATKMANVWEQKIGSDLTHSPRTVQDSSEGKSSAKSGPRVNLTKAGKASPSAEMQKKNTKEITEESDEETRNLQKRNTKEIVNSFEKMASLTEAGGGVLPKYGKKKSIVSSGAFSKTTSISENGTTPMSDTNSVNKDEVYAMIEKMNQDIAGMSKTLKALKSKVDDM